MKKRESMPEPVKSEVLSSHEKREKFKHYMGMIRQYVDEPYTYDLPEKMVDVEDPNYRYYMCRNSIWGIPTGYIELAIQDLGGILTKDELAQLRGAYVILRNIAKTNKEQEKRKRTVEEMQLIREALETAVHALSHALARTQ